MTPSLTPYDTGDRLEPQPWRLTDNDHYGYVDLDDDESATVFTLVGKRYDDGSQGYLLSVSTYCDDSAVEIDGDRVLVLDEDTLAGLNTLVELAEDYAVRPHSQTVTNKISLGNFSFTFYIGGFCLESDYMLLFQLKLRSVFYGDDALIWWNEPR